MAMWAVREYSGFNCRGDVVGGEVEWSIVGLAPVDVWLATVVRCLTERKTCGVSGRSCRLVH